MFGLLKALFLGPQAAGPAVSMQEFTPGPDVPLAPDISLEDGTWRVPVRGEVSIPLFNWAVPPGTDKCLLTYRVRLRPDGLEGFVYLEMWCSLINLGRFFSKGLKDRISGTRDWSEHEVQFMLKAGQHPDRLELNLFANGSGTVWIDRITILKTPLR